MKSLIKRLEDLFKPAPIKTIDFPSMLLTQEPDPTLPRIASALERIADALEKQNAGREPLMKMPDKIMLENNMVSQLVHMGNAQLPIYPELNAKETIRQGEIKGHMR